MLTICLILVVVMLSAGIYLYEEKHGKTDHRFSAIVLLLLIYVLLAGNYENADTKNYETEYINNYTGYGLSLSGYWGYYLLDTLCRALTLTYYQSRFVVYGTGIFILLTAISRMHINKYTALVLYMLFPMIIDSTQTRNFVAMSLLTLALSFLSGDRKRNKFFFLGLVILAAGFHPIFYIYLPLAVCDSKKLEARFVLPIAIFSLIFANKGMSSLLADFIRAHLDDFLGSRANEFIQVKPGGYWVDILATAIAVTLVHFMRKAILLSADSTVEEKCFSNIMMYCALFSLLFLPFYYWEGDFARLLRSFFPAFHILFIMFLKVRNTASDGQGKREFIFEFHTAKPLFIIGYLMLVVYMFYWNTFIFKDTVVKPFFTYNSVVDAIQALFRNLLISGNG